MQEILHNTIQNCASMKPVKKKLGAVNVGLSLVILVAVVGVDGHREGDGNVPNDKVTQEDDNRGGPPAPPWTSWLDDRHILSVIAPVSDAVETPECQSDSRRFVEGVRARELWALKMVDASTKLPDGALAGNLLHLGNYDECLSIRGRHCLVTLGDGFFSSVSPVDRLAGVDRFRNMADRADALAGDASSFLRELGATVSLCVPASCTSHDLELHLRSELRNAEVNVSLSVDVLGCHSREDEEPFSTLDWFAILVLSALLAAAGVSSYYELTQRDSASSQLLGSFSVWTNTRALLDTRPRADDVGMATLDGLRVLNSLFVFVAHCSSLKVFITACSNMADNERSMYELQNMPFITTLPVDSFFLLSGLLVSYNFLKDRENGVKFSLARFYIHRLVRMTPCYAMAVLLTSTVLYHMGDGPLWKTNMAPLRDGCRDEWFYGLIYIYNYYPSAESLLHIRCMSESWYLSVDMQLFCLAPLILYPLWRWPRLGRWLIAVLMAVGLTIAFAVPYVYRLRYTLAPFNRAYVTTHTRFTPWLLGVALGYALHTTKRSPPALPSGLVVTGHLLSGLLMVAALFTPYYFLREDYVYGRISTSLFYCLMRPGWALALAWVAFTAARGYNSLVYSVLWWPKFQVLSRLSYSLYLTQVGVLRLVYLTTRVPYHVTGLTVIVDNLGILGLTLAVSYLLHVLVEAPFCNVEKYLNKTRCAAKTAKKIQ